MTLLSCQWLVPHCEPLHQNLAIRVPDSSKDLSKRPGRVEFRSASSIGHILFRRIDLAVFLYLGASYQTTNKPVHIRKGLFLVLLPLGSGVVRQHGYTLAMSRGATRWQMRRKPHSLDSVSGLWEAQSI